MGALDKLCYDQLDWLWFPSLLFPGKPACLFWILIDDASACESTPITEQNEEPGQLKTEPIPFFESCFIILVFA